MPTIYQETRIKDMSPEEKLRCQLPSDIDVPGVENPESVEVRKARNPDTE